MNYMEQIQKHPIFADLTQDEIKLIMNCFSFVLREYKKNSYILLEGDSVHTVGLIIKGTILMEKGDQNGNDYFFTELREGEIFADLFMGELIQNSSVNYKALNDCSILFFHYKTMWQPCNKNCVCHSKFTENLMNLLAIKTRSLLAKIEILSKNSIRERILTFLQMVKNNEHLIGFHKSSYHKTNNYNSIFMPLNRTEMAKYLCVNRSALVRELSNMKKEGILTFDKNTFFW